MKLFWFPIAYVIVISLLALHQHREFRQYPEKRARYRRLPIAYKAACWLGVVPLFVAAFFVHGALLFAGFIGFYSLEALCIRWYRRNDAW